MNDKVFDIHVITIIVYLMHFDVLVTPEHAGKAKLYAQQFLQQQGYNSDDIQQQSCDFCHNEIATPAVIAAINAQGYYILKLQGC